MNGQTEWNCYHVNTQTGEVVVAGGGSASKEVLSASLLREWSTWDNTPFPASEGWTVEYREEPAGTYDQWRRAQRREHWREDGILIAWTQEIRNAQGEPVLALFLARDPSEIPEGMEDICSTVDGLTTLRAYCNGWTSTGTALLLTGALDTSYAHGSAWYRQRHTPGAIVLPDGEQIELPRRIDAWDRSDIMPPEAAALFGIQDAGRGRTLTPVYKPQDLIV